MNKILPNLTGKYIINPNNSLKIIGGIEVGNDIFNESMPATTKTGILYNMYDNYENLIKNINNYLYRNDKNVE